MPAVAWNTKRTDFRPDGRTYDQSGAGAKAQFDAEEYEKPSDPRAHALLHRAWNFSVMWSEHCSYKNSRPLLKTFPTRSPKILVSAGEETPGSLTSATAGHRLQDRIPQSSQRSGALSGGGNRRGGIIRDIFTMGARPICA